MLKRHVRAAGKLQPLHVPRTGFTLFHYGALGLSFRMLLALTVTAAAIFYVVGRTTILPGAW